MSYEYKRSDVLAIWLGIGLIYVLSVGAICGLGDLNRRIAALERQASLSTPAQGAEYWGWEDTPAQGAK